MSLLLLFRPPEGITPPLLDPVIGGVGGGPVARSMTWLEIEEWNRTIDDEEIALTLSLLS